MHIFYRKHYPRSSWFNKIIVKAAIVFRMVISAITTTLIKPITQLFKHKVKACDTYIVSRQPNNIMNIIENEGFSSNNELTSRLSKESVAIAASPLAKTTSFTNPSTFIILSAEAEPDKI